jgi:hypothetical protein
MDGLQRGKGLLTRMVDVADNARLASSYCLFGIPGGVPPSNPCITQ